MKAQPPRGIRFVRGGCVPRAEVYGAIAFFLALAGLGWLGSVMASWR